MLRLTRREQVMLIGFLILILIASGMYMYERPSMATQVPLPKLAESSGQTGNAAGISETGLSKPSSEVTVDVKGAVHAPGVFTLPGGSRIVDAIQAAGGATDQADLESINLAQKLQDGSSVTVPIKGQAAGATAGSASSSHDSSTPTGKVNINLATVDQLDTLEGIGSTRAKAIIQYREQHGPFQSVDDLLQVKGIGPKLLETIRDRLTVY